MKRYFWLIIKAIGGGLLVLVLLLLGAAIALNSSSIQNRIRQKATTMLAERLQTKVHIEGLEWDFFRQEFQLTGVEIEDLQRRKMFVMRELNVRLAVLPLLSKEVNISKARINGLYAALYKEHPDTAANYQFVIDAFKKGKPEPRDSEPKTKEPVTFDVKHASVSDVEASYNDNTLSLKSIRYDKDWRDRQQLRLEQVRVYWDQMTRKGMQRNHAGIGVLEAKETDHNPTLHLGNVRFATDNHLPRKNTGRPKRGFFDAGHLDFLAQLDLELLYIDKDSIVAQLTHGEACDSVTGFDIRQLQAHVSATKHGMHLSDVLVTLPNTEIHIESGMMQFPNKREGRTIAYETSLVKGTTQLKDISRAFAPVLYKFSLPVNFEARMKGDDQKILFSDIFVHTPDNRLTVKAKGHLHELKDKYKLKVHFDVQEMRARNSVVPDIISQFPIKKFMMKQLKALGIIRFNGSMDVHYKHEFFAGLLRTAVGNMNVRLEIDDINKYLLGHVRSNSLELGKVIDMPSIGKIKGMADIKFDISKQRTAKMRRIKGGKLPMGNVQAHVDEASYKKIKVRNIYADIVSDGAEAIGDLNISGRRTDVLCSFSFKDTEEMHKMRIKPGIRFHGLSDENKAKDKKKELAKEKAKAKKKRIKEQEKAKKKRAKEQRKLKTQQGQGST
ncbi:MAG: AsmA family protein [Bacteroidales bacterium]|nr:AsmA family protein [Bacteroidales bacterium]